MTRPIQDWRDAYEAMHDAASIAKDTLSNERLTQIRALIEQTENGVQQCMGIADTISMRGSAVMQERQRIYERAIGDIAEGPAREAALLLERDDSHNYVKSSDEIKGCVALIAAVFNVPHHAVIEDICDAYRELFGGDNQ